MKNAKALQYSETSCYPHNSLIRTIEKIAADINISSDVSQLDAGCGNGYLMNRLYSKGYKNIWGFDLSFEGIDAAKQYKDLKNNVAVHDLYDKELPKGFPKAEYDVVWSIEVIEHLFDPKLYLENINHWLKRDGLLILSTPYHGYLKNIAIVLANKFDSHFNPVSVGWHIKYFSKTTLCGLLEDTGFKCVKFYGSGRMPYLWKSMVMVSKKL